MVGLPLLNCRCFRCHSVFWAVFQGFAHPIPTLSLWRTSQSITNALSDLIIGQDLKTLIEQLSSSALFDQGFKIAFDSIQLDKEVLRAWVTSLQPKWQAIQAFYGLRLTPESTKEDVYSALYAQKQQQWFQAGFKQHKSRTVHSFNLVTRYARTSPEVF